MAGYLNDDEQYAALLAPTINPPDPDTVKTGTSSGVRPAQAPYAQGVSRPPDAGAVRSISPPAQTAAPAQPAAQAQPSAPAQAAVPAAASPSGNASSGPSLRDQLKASLARQSQAVQGSEASTAALQAQPDLGTATAPIEAQRTQLAQPIDPNQQQYKPGLATRIARGFAAGSKGGIAGWLDPSSVGDTPYGAPNSKYGVATAQQAQKLAATDQQLSQKAQAYKDYSTRIKDIAAGQKDDTLGEKDLQGSINNAQKNDETYKKGLAALGQKEDDNGNIVSDEDSPIYQQKQTQAKLNDANAQLKLAGNDPGSPAYKLAYQRAQTASSNANAANIRANAYALNATGANLGTDPQGKPLNAIGIVGGKPVGTRVQAQATKAMGNIAKFQDVYSSIDNANAAINEGDKHNVKFNTAAMAEALSDPKTTSGQWLAGKVNTTLNPQEQNIVITTKALHEQIMAMRGAIGSGGVSDTQASRLIAQLPSATTPDMNYARRQLATVRQQLDRLQAGLPGVNNGPQVQSPGAPANPTNPGGVPRAIPQGNTPAQPAGQIPPQAAKVLQEGKIHTFNNGQQWTMQGGKPVRVQ